MVVVRRSRLPRCKPAATLWLPVIGHLARPAFRLHGGRRTPPPRSCTVAQSNKCRRASGSTDPPAGVRIRRLRNIGRKGGSDVLCNGLELWHLLIVAVVLVALSGSEKLPDLARMRGKSMRILKV
ncbi:twin-arginine translocase TatA/TatE family subunit [Streptomyces sp. NPDC051664]|uniref:twin-arginine translocase TatA/TatE family subunit n=1 Tax=Streptomyces sp. NPDC051664 TaxID=3365668 RepID=UPI0037A9407C